MLAIYCKEAGDPLCSHTITESAEQELFDNAKKHVMESPRVSAQEFEEDAKKMRKSIGNLIKEI